jgi:hypothetical protein
MDGQRQTDMVNPVYPLQLRCGGIITEKGGAVRIDTSWIRSYGTFQHLKDALREDPINTELVTKMTYSDGYEPTISNTVPQSSELFFLIPGYNNRKGGSCANRYQLDKKLYKMTTKLIRGNNR